MMFLLACDQPSYEPGGTRISPYFPLDGHRTAHYVRDGIGDAPDALRVEKLEPGSLVGEETVFTFVYTHEVEGTLLGQVQWSSEPGEGVKIHGYAEGTEAITPFEPPIDFSDPQDLMQRGDSVVTQSSGMRFESTFLAFEDCPVAWGYDDWNCVHVRLDDGDGDDTTGPFFAGDYWLFTRYGPAWMRLTGQSESEVWDLADYEWESDPDSP